MTKSPLFMSCEEFERLGLKTLALAAGHMADQERTPVHRDLPEETRQQLMSLPLADRGLAPEDILSFLDDTLLRYPLGNGHRQFFAWINPPPAPIGVLADTLSNSVNATSDGFEHAGTYLQVSTGRWLMELCGFPTEGSLALFLSGGSMANLTALAGARHKAAKTAGWNLREDGLQGGHKRLVLYTSDQSHSSVQKAVELLGLGNRNLRAVPSDDAFRMRVDALEAAIQNDLVAGHQPFCVVAVAGSTNTGAIDPLEAIADCCRRHGLWFHVDGAYGALGRLDPDYAPLYRGVERADSLVLDPHKRLMVPVDCGVVFLRDPALQREAFSLVPAYLQSETPGGAPMAHEYMLPLTYANRVIKTWATVARLGRSGTRDLILRGHSLAQNLAQRVERAPELELLAPPSLSIVCFRYRPAGLEDEPKIDSFNSALIERLCADGEVFLTATEVAGKTSLRVCIMHYDADVKDIDALLSAVHRVGRELIEG